MYYKSLITFCFALIVSVSAFSKTITIVTFNDFHGHLTYHKKDAGMARFVTAIEHAKHSHPHPLLVAGGDLYQGSVMSNLLFGKPVNRMMRQMGVQLSAVGNHEFDWGTTHFKAWEQQGGFQFLSANVINKKTHHYLPFVKPYAVLNDDGVKIAFIGLTTQETVNKALHKNVAPWRFKDAAKTARYWVNYLTAHVHPNVIIALTHIASIQNHQTGKITGWELKPLSKVKGLNAVVSAHSHLLVSGYLNGMPVVQADHYGRAIGFLTIHLNKQNHITNAASHGEPKARASSPR